MKKEIDRNFYLTVWHLDTWRDFLRAGGDTYGLPESYEKLAAKLKPDDYLICYLAGRSEFFAVLEVAGRCFHSTRLIWSAGVYPVRVKVRRTIDLGRGVSVKDMADKLSFLTPELLTSHRQWSNHFHCSIKPWKPEDAWAVVKALIDADGAKRQSA
jgi:predicted RNA-binding protein